MVYVWDEARVPGVAEMQEGQMCIPDTDIHWITGV